MLFDTTSIYFEGQGPEGLAEYGYSRDHRPDRVRVMLELLMSREGMPVAHYVFPGNTADINAFRSALTDLEQRFPLRRVVIMADRGMVSEPLLEELEREGVGIYRRHAAQALEGGKGDGIEPCRTLS